MIIPELSGKSTTGSTKRFYSKDSNFMMSSVSWMHYHGANSVVFLKYENVCVM
jgi:hypothetical protein